MHKQQRHVGHLTFLTPHIRWLDPHDHAAPRPLDVSSVVPGAALAVLREADGVARRGRLTSLYPTSKLSRSLAIARCPSLPSAGLTHELASAFSSAVNEASCPHTTVTRSIHEGVCP